MWFPRSLIYKCLQVTQHGCLNLHLDLLEEPEALVTNESSLCSQIIIFKFGCTISHTAFFFIYIPCLFQWIFPNSPFSPFPSPATHLLLKPSILTIPCSAFRSPISYDPSSHKIAPLAGLLLAPWLFLEPQVEHRTLATSSQDAQRKESMQHLFFCSWAASLNVFVPFPSISFKFHHFINRHRCMCQIYVIHLSVDGRMG